MARHLPAHTPTRVLQFPANDQSLVQQLLADTCTTLQPLPPHSILTSTPELAYVHQHPICCQYTHHFLFTSGPYRQLLTKGKLNKNLSRLSDWQIHPEKVHLVLFRQTTTHIHQTISHQTGTHQQHLYHMSLTKSNRTHQHLPPQTLQGLRLLIVW